MHVIPQISEISEKQNWLFCTKSRKQIRYNIALDVCLWIFFPGCCFYRFVSQFCLFVRPITNPWALNQFPTGCDSSKRKTEWICRPEQTVYPHPCPAVCHLSGRWVRGRLFGLTHGDQVEWTSGRMKEGSDTGTGSDTTGARCSSLSHHLHITWGDLLFESKDLRHWRWEPSKWSLSLCWMGCR